MTQCLRLPRVPIPPRSVPRPLSSDPGTPWGAFAVLRDQRRAPSGWGAGHPQQRRPAGMHTDSALSLVAGSEFWELARLTSLGRLSRDVNRGPSDPRAGVCFSDCIPRQHSLPSSGHALPLCLFPSSSKPGDLFPILERTEGFEMGKARAQHGLYTAGSWGHLWGAASCPWFPGLPLHPGYCGPDLSGLLLGSWTKNEGSLLLWLVCTISAADWEGSLETSSSDHPAQTQRGRVVRPAMLL